MIIIDREAIKGDNMFGSVCPFVYLNVYVLQFEVCTLCACCAVVDIRARLAECNKITMTHGIQSNISVCLSVIRGHL